MPTFSSVTFKPARDAGNLMSIFSEEGVGANNYVEKNNWRKRENTEGRREGDVLFTPTFGERADDFLPDPNPIEEIFSVQHPNGEVALFALTRERIYRYNALTEGDYVWNLTNPGIDDTPYVAFMVDQKQGDKVLILNSDKADATLDDNYLPGQTVRIRLITGEIKVFTVASWDYTQARLEFVEPLPAGVAIEWVDANYFAFNSGTWLNINPSGYVFSNTAKRWQWGEVAGEVIFNNGVDLPVCYNILDTQAQPMFELRERCIARCETMEIFGGMCVFCDITSIRKDAFEDWMNGDDPYGLYDDPINEQRRRWRVFQGVHDDCSSWGAVATGTILQGDSVLRLRKPMESFRSGTEIVVEGAGPGESNLRATIIGVTDNKTFTLNVNASESVFDRSATSCANLKAAAPPCFYDLIEGGDAILRALKFDDDNLLIYKNEGSIFHGRLTGKVDQPILFDRVYEGKKALHYRWSLELIDADDGRYHLFVGRDKMFRVGPSFIPQEHPTFAMCRDTFFENFDEDTPFEPFAKMNHVNDEYWLNYRTEDDEIRSMIFSYRWGDVGTSTRKYTAYGTVNNPFEGKIDNTSDKWFLAGDSNGRVMLHASTNKREALLNGRKGFWGIRGRMTGPDRTLMHDGKYLIASSDFFTIDDVDKYVFISQNDLTYDIRKITQWISSTHVITDNVTESDPYGGGVFDEYLDNGILDGLEPFVSEDGAGQEEDEIEMEAITPIMGSKDSGGPVTLEVWTAKQPSDERLGTKVKRVERIITNPRYPRVGMWFRGNYFQTKISVNNSLLDARLSSKIYRFRRLKASDGLTRTPRSQHM